MKRPKLFIVLVLLFTTSIQLSCTAQKGIVVLAKSSKSIKEYKIYKVTITNNYSDSICLIPIALEYSLEVGANNRLSYIDDSTNKKRKYYISVSENSLDNVIKYYKLMPKGEVTFNIQIVRNDVYNNTLVPAISLVAMSDVSDEFKSLGKKYLSKKPSKAQTRFIELRLM